MWRERILLAVCCVGIASFLCACQERVERPVSYFETAEQAYRIGQYEVAHQNYSAFLKQNPDPQLARLAERRILSIEREIECVLGQSSGPRPAYVSQEDPAGSAKTQQTRVLYKSERQVRMPFHD